MLHRLILSCLSLLLVAETAQGWHFETVSGEQVSAYAKVCVPPSCPPVYDDSATCGLSVDCSAAISMLGNSAHSAIRCCLYPRSISFGASTEASAPGDFDAYASAGLSDGLSLRAVSDPGDGLNAVMVATWSLSAFPPDEMIDYGAEASLVVYYEWPPVFSVFADAEDNPHSEGMGVVIVTVTTGWQFTVASGMSAWYMTDGVESGSATGYWRIDLIGLLPDGSPECPDHDPERWNGTGPPNYQRSNNCYNYATNRHTNTYAQPGRHGGGPAPRPFTVEGVRAAAIADGLVQIDEGESCGSGCKVALLVTPDGYDYHWLRQGHDGLWSHKEGQYPVKLRDDTTSPITDPAAASISVQDKSGNWHTYSEFGGYFCVPTEANVRLSGERAEGVGDPSTPVRDDEVSVSSLQYCGLPDPHVVLTDSLEIGELRGMLEELPQVDDPGWNTGPRGFALSINLPEFDGPILVREGVIGIYDWFGNPTYYQDVHGLENWLDQHVTGVGDTPTASPPAVSLTVAPSVFSGGATLTYSVSMPSRVLLEVFSVSGRRVRKLMDGLRQPGTYEASWDGRDDAGREVSSGVYFFRLETTEGKGTATGILLR